MKKLIIITSIMLAAVSCDIIGESSSQRDSRMKDESIWLARSYIVLPASYTDFLLLVDDYLQAPEGQKDSSIYSDVRNALFKGDGESWLVEGFGILDTRGESLHEPGTVWKLDFKDSYYQIDIEGFSFECVAEDLWSVVASDDNVTAVKYGDEGVLTVATFGERKTSDGYDCSFRTEGEFKVILDKEERHRCEWIKGKFVHSVGRGNDVLETCEAEYQGNEYPAVFKLVK